MKKNLIFHGANCALLEHDNKIIKGNFYDY